MSKKDKKEDGKEKIKFSSLNIHTNMLNKKKSIYFWF